MSSLRVYRVVAVIEAPPGVRRIVGIDHVREIVTVAENHLTAQGARDQVQADLQKAGLVGIIVATYRAIDIETQSEAIARGALEDVVAERRRTG